MRRAALFAGVLVMMCAAAAAEPPPAVAPGVPSSITLQPVAIYDRDGKVVGGAGAPLAVLTMPFRRLHSAPIRLTALGPAPKTFPLSRPAEATTYRIVIPCDVDVRLLGTMTAGESVAADTGLLYLARTEATMGTSRPNFISAMTVGTPTGDCTPEMHYGMGGG